MTSERNARIMEMVADGKTYGQISAELGVSRSVIAGVVHRNRETPADPVKARSTRGEAAPFLDDDGRLWTSCVMAANFHGISHGAARLRACLGVKGWRRV